MLLQIKAGLSHGEWLPWLKRQQESGAIEFSQPTASKYMRLAANYNRDFNLEGATSIRAALELLSDKEQAEEQQGSLIDVEAERQLRLAAESKAAEEPESEARGIFEQRARESQADPPHGVFIRPGNEEAQRSNHAGLFSLSELSTGRHIH